MKTHLNYDGKQSNGIIFNSKYTKGALFNGADLKPKLSFEYYYMQYSEVFDIPNYVLDDNMTRRLMTASEEEEVRKLATNWVQPTTQEGGVIFEKAKAVRSALILKMKKVAIAELIAKGYTAEDINLVYPEYKKTA